MKDFIYDGGVKIIYGAEQQTLVAQEIAKLGNAKAIAFGALNQEQPMEKYLLKKKPFRS